jgi:hypothetical protein
LFCLHAEQGACKIVSSDLMWNDLLLAIGFRLLPLRGHQERLF